MIRFAKELNLDLSDAERDLNRSGTLTPEQAGAVRDFGKQLIRRLIIVWPVGTIVAPWPGQARKGPTTSKGTTVTFGSWKKRFRWHLPADIADTIVDGAAYTLYQNRDVLHWFELTDWSRPC